MTTLKIGIIESIKNAATESELEAHLSTLRSYTGASNKTVRRAQRAAAEVRAAWERIERAKSAKKAAKKTAKKAAA